MPRRPTPQPMLGKLSRRSRHPVPLSPRPRALTDPQRAHTTQPNAHASHEENAPTCEATVGHTGCAHCLGYTPRSSTPTGEQQPYTMKLHNYLRIRSEGKLGGCVGCFVLYCGDARRVHVLASARRPQAHNFPMAAGASCPVARRWKCHHHLKHSIVAWLHPR